MFFFFFFFLSHTFTLFCVNWTIETQQMQQSCAPQFRVKTVELLVHWTGPDLTRPDWTNWTGTNWTALGRTQVQSGPAQLCVCGMRVGGVWQPVQCRFPTSVHFCPNLLQNQKEVSCELCIIFPPRQQEHLKWLFFFLLLSSVRTPTLHTQSCHSLELSLKPVKKN